MIQVLTYLSFQDIIFEAKQQGLTVFGPQMVNTTSIYGTHKILINLVLGILGAFRAVAETKSIKKNKSKKYKK